MTRDEIYNEVIQDYSDLQYEYKGDELQDKINEIVDDYYDFFTMYEEGSITLETLTELINDYV